MATPTPIRCDADVTFRTHAERWLVRVAPSAKRSSLVVYEDVVRRYFVPLLGGAPLAALTRGMLRDALDTLTARGLAAATVARARAVLSMIFTDAVERDLVAYNPVREIRGPKPKRARRLVIPTAPELARLLTEAAACAAPARLMLYEILAGAALRVGEAQALRPGDLDMATQRLRVARTVVRAPGGGVDDPKGGLERWVDLPDSLAQKLRGFVAVRQECDWLFPGQTGRAPISYPIIRREMRVIATAAKLPGVTAHALRHARASLWIAAGADIEWVRRQLGHSDISITVGLYGKHAPMRSQAVLRDLSD